MLFVIIYFLSFWGGGAGERNEAVMPSILESILDCLMSWDKGVCNPLTSFYKTLTPFMLGPELLLCKTLAKHGISSVAQKAHIVQFCATLFDMIQPFLPLSSIIKCHNFPGVI